MGLKIGSPREIYAGEARVAMTPDSATQLQKLGYECVIESGAGKAAGLSDDAYRAAGVTVVETAAALFETADIIAKVRPPETSEVDRLGPGKTLISFFYPAQNSALLEQAKAKGATVVAMDMVPRISRAQKMDALSSMANIAGYRAVIEAGNNFGRFFTGQSDSGRQGAAGQGAGHWCGRRGSCCHRYGDFARCHYLCLRRSS